MTDLKTLIDSVSLTKCKREIDAQFESISQHPNVIKLAVLASFILGDAMSVIKDINTNRFLESLKAELEKEVKEAENLKYAQGIYMEHLEKNQELITNFESRRNELKAISEELSRLLTNYDNLLRDMAIERCNKSIAEIEAEL